MRKTTVYLEDETSERLRQMSAASGRPQAELIRDAVEVYTRKFRAARIVGVGKYRSGRSDVSERAEEILKRAFRKR